MPASVSLFRPIGLCLFVVCAIPWLAACPEDLADGDGGTTRTDVDNSDAGIPQTDAGAEDAGAPQTDAGTEDGGATQSDAGAEDAGAPQTDAGTEDGGATQPDAGSENTDPCLATSESNLPGVSIEFPTGPCQWTLAEAQAGLQISYQVIINSAVTGVVPLPQDTGNCGQPGSSGLTLFEEIGGGGHNYCICDTGLCSGIVPDPVTLNPGTFENNFMWDGVNWTGPSDFGNPKGDPFPAGTYTLTISAKGNWLAPGSTDAVPFEVKGTRQVELAP